MKLRYQWGLYIALVLLIPWASFLALPPHGGTVWQHWLYPFGHANFLHWFINALAWFGLWRLVTAWRFVCAYLSSVLLGYFYSCFCFSPATVAVLDYQLTIFNSRPVLGFSVIIYWFLGLLLPYISSDSRLRLLALCFIALFIPGIAALFHLMALCMGLLYATIRLTKPKTK